jgi:gamma-glutamyltranspeptidase/glutathione hydrolase
MNLQEAIDAPAWHSEHFPISFWPRTARPGVLVVRTACRKATVDELTRRGHNRPRDRPDWSEGRSPLPRRSGRAAAPPLIRGACRATAGTMTR